MTQAEREECARWEAFSASLVEVRVSDTLAKLAPHLVDAGRCRGVFVRPGVTIVRGQVIGRYCGEELSAMALIVRYGVDTVAEYALQHGRRIVDAASIGTCARYINDYRFGMGPGPNVAFRDFDVVALTEMGPGTELLVSYGEGYWRGFRDRLDRLDRRERRERGRGPGVSP
jgi:hypothetical protein